MSERSYHGATSRSLQDTSSCSETPDRRDGLWFRGAQAGIFSGYGHVNSSPLPSPTPPHPTPHTLEAFSQTTFNSYDYIFCRTKRRFVYLWKPVTNEALFEA